MPKLKTTILGCPNLKLEEKHIKESGGKHLAVYKDAESPNMVTVLTEFTDLENAKNFFSSESTMKRMVKGGVIGKPEIHIMKDQYLF